MKQQRYCSRCGQPISDKSESGLCRTCFNQVRVKKSSRRCAGCGKPILQSNKSGYCKKCYSIYVKQKARHHPHTRYNVTKQKCWHCGRRLSEEKWKAGERFCNETCRTLFHQQAPSNWIENRGNNRLKPIGGVI